MPHAVDEAHLAGQISRSQHGDGGGLARPRVLDDLERTLEDDVERVVAGAFLDQVLVRRHAANLHQRGECGALFGRELGAERGARYETCEGVRGVLGAPCFGHELEPR
jgi:hypothetical protein